ncbi:Coenzyme F420 hydrogenase/dehydrogenase, beta subunit C-terminal domain [Georgenia alba]|uniref:Coenzyme F420 hydrogenase/dehydrogenase, beta subunit C-terminal domain n=1 Tax=Georgenia alba TaxID=2233858 RepID=A0ABW2Q574_9MICO
MASETAEAAPTILDVVARRMCVGCGACAVRTGGAVPVTIGRRGYYEADPQGADRATLAAACRVCPFANESPDEDEVASEVFASTLPVDGRVGRYLGTYAGRLADDDAVYRSSSGGLTSWFLAELLSRGEVDRVIHVGPTSSGPRLFEYRVASTAEELLASRKSAYYSTTFADVVRGLRGDGRRYAMVGVPCFVQAMRLLTREDETLRDQVRFLVGIVCGHMKASGFAESLAWQQGVAPEDLAKVDFRIKSPHDASAKRYRFGAWGTGADSPVAQMPGRLVGGQWGHAAFQLNACNFCDDVYAETADVVFGDAWLPRHEADPRGMNVVITRTDAADRILRAGATAGRVRLEDVTVDELAQAQAGNYRHRREGLAVRLADDIAEGAWVPRKRVEPGYRVSRRRLRLVRERRRLAELSFTLFEEAKVAGDLRVYVDRMRPLVRRHDRISRPLSRRLRSRATAEAWRLVRSIRGVGR